MIVKIRITTAPDMAEAVEKKLRFFLLPLGSKPQTTITSNKILWIVDTTPAKVIRINRNVALFDGIITNVLQSKMLRKAVKKETVDELADLLKNQTKVEIIKGEYNE
jgi:hypothetical protein